MDDSAKNVSSYQVDQEILEARGINMTVEEVAGLPTCKYSERVQSMKLSDEDRAFLKGLRRRIKNRLASQNSRRRSVEHLRRLTRELRAVRACRDDAVSDRRALQAQRDAVRDKCALLRRHLVQILLSRSDQTEVPSIEVDLPPNPTRSPTLKLPSISPDFKETLIIRQESEDDDNVYVRVRQEIIKEEKRKDPREEDIKDMSVRSLKNDLFECKIGKLVTQSVNHIFNEKKVFAKTVFIANDKLSSNVTSLSLDSGGEVLNLCVKEGRRKSHGRKQSAPRRITYCALEEDGVLDLKIKKESQ